MMSYCKTSDLVDANPPTIEDLEEIGIPATSILCDFVVQILESEEFLALKKGDEAITSKIWSLVPNLAPLFPNPEIAANAASDCSQGTGVFALLDTGDTFFAWLIS